MHSWSIDWRGGFAPKLVAAAAVVALGDWLFYQHKWYGGAFGLLGLGLVAALLLTRPAVRGDLRALALAALAGGYALAMAWDASLLAFVLFWIAAGLATLLPGTARFDDGWRWFQRLVAHGVMALVGPLMDWFRLLRQRRLRRGRRTGRRARIGVIALPLLGSAVILSLFAAANPVIESLLNRLSLPDFDEWTVLRLALWAFLFTLAWGLLRPRLARRLFGTFDGRGDVYLPGVSVASVTLSLIAFNALFALQNAMDLAWLWGLMPLPEGMTLAEYAHRGAYPLVVTALLAALFVLIALRPGSQTANVPLIRIMVVAWIAQNLFLVFNAALRTIDYVEAYSLTVLRISALLWMGLVAAGLVLTCWRLLRERNAAWLINANLATTGLLLSAVCLVDLGSVAAQWNVRHAKEIDGNGAALDLCYLHGLGGSALLPLVELEQRKLPDDLHQRVRNVRIDVMRRLEMQQQEGGWTWRAGQRLAEARQTLGEYGDLPPFRAVDCYGNIYAGGNGAEVAKAAADAAKAAVDAASAAPAAPASPLPPLTPEAKR